MNQRFVSTQLLSRNWWRLALLLILISGWAIHFAVYLPFLPWASLLLLGTIVVGIFWNEWFWTPYKRSRLGPEEFAKQEAEEELRRARFSQEEDQRRRNKERFRQEYLDSVRRAQEQERILEDLLNRDSQIREEARRTTEWRAGGTKAGGSTKVFSQDQLKKLHRVAAKRFHPDLASDQEERLRMEKLMQQANVALENNDGESLEKLLAENP